MLRTTSVGCRHRYLIISLLRTKRCPNAGEERNTWMIDSLTPEQRSERMSRIRNRNSGVEWLVRRLVHGMGYRYRLHGKGLPGKPDLVFPRKRKVIFVHGCFWHRHPDPACKLARLPKSRLDFWEPKLEANKKRDQENEHALGYMGWKTLTVWECETSNKEELTERLKSFLD